MTKTVQLTLRNETKGAVRYEETGYKDNPSYLIGTLYLRKTGLGTPVPQAIKVTVEGA